jgi:hypothetical protein
LSALALNGKVLKGSGGGFRWRNFVWRQKRPSRKWSRRYDLYYKNLRIKYYKNPRLVYAQVAALSQFSDTKGLRWGVSMTEFRVEAKAAIVFSDLSGFRSFHWSKCIPHVLQNATVQKHSNWSHTVNAIQSITHVSENPGATDDRMLQNCT